MTQSNSLFPFFLKVLVGNNNGASWNWIPKSSKQSFFKTRLNDLCSLDKSLPQFYFRFKCGWHRESLHRCNIFPPRNYLLPSCIRSIPGVGKRQKQMQWSKWWQSKNEPKNNFIIYIRIRIHFDSLYLSRSHAFLGLYGMKYGLCPIHTDNSQGPNFGQRRHWGNGAIDFAAKSTKNGP